MNEPVEQTSSAVAVILHKLEGCPIAHVPDNERRAAIQRAVEQIGVSASLSVEDLLTIIATNEGSVDVHSAPSDA